MGQTIQRLLSRLLGSYTIIVHINALSQPAKKKYKGPVRA